MFIVFMICELCGRETSFLSSVRVGSTLSKACSGCKRYGSAAQEVVASSPVINSPFLTSISRPITDLVGSEEFIVADFDRRIRAARQRSGLKQDEVAKQLMEKASIIRAVENGRRKPNLKLAKRLEKVLDVNLIEILD